MKKIIYFTIGTVLFLSCRKENSEKTDQVSTQDVKGMVYNNCTDSGLAGVKVYFQVFRDEKNIVENIETTSGKDGNFIFSNVDIHNSDKYSYIASIGSKSGIGAQDSSQALFIGTSMYLNGDEVDRFLKLKVTPGFLRVKLFYKNVPTTKSDSITVLFTQKTFHTNVPDLSYQLPGGAYGDRDDQFDQYGDYPMGLYNITINKYKSGIHTLSYDSIYLGWGATQSHTINW